MIVNDDSGSIVAHFIALSRQIPRGSEEGRGKYQQTPVRDSYQTPPVFVSCPLSQCKLLCIKKGIGEALQSTWSCYHWFASCMFPLYTFTCSQLDYTRVGTLIVATIYLQLIQNRYMFRSFIVLHCSHQHCVQPVASDVEVVGYL